MTEYSHPLVEFIGFQLDEQEDLAKTAILPEHMHPYGDTRIPVLRPDQYGDQVKGYLGGPWGDHAAYWSPTQVLAEVHAKRQIIELHAPVDGGEGWHDWEATNGVVCNECGNVDDRPVPWPCDTLKWLGQPYQDHEDYQGAWSVLAPR